MKRPTQKDVAELAGVSRGTVSIVLNGRDSGRVPISEETRTKVLDAAEKIGYAPNPVAQMLAKGQNQIIGVFVYADVFPYQKSDYFFPYLSGIQHAAIRQNYNVLLFTQNHHQEAMAQVYENSMNTLRLADGCIFMGSDTNRDELARLHDENYPFVYVGRRDIPDRQINWVINDYTSGTADATRHLLNHGHRNLGFVANQLTLEPQRDKIQGCHQVLDKQPDVSLSLLNYENNDYERVGLVEHIRDENITALMCTDDDSFHITIDVLTRAGLRIPDDISVVSLTTAEFDATVGLQPSHLHLNRPAIGEKAIEVLIQLINGEIQSPQQIIMPATFVAGETTGPCPI